MPEATTDIVQDLTEAATAVSDISSLVESSQKAFQLLEPWCHAVPRERHPAVAELVAETKRHAVVYFEAIDLSVEVSAKGRALADDAVNLCDFLQRQEPGEHILPFLEDMQALARETHDEAKRMHDKFKEVRFGLMQMQQNILPRVEHIAAEMDGLTVVAHRFREAADVAERVEKALSNPIAVASAIAPVVLPMLAIPHLAIILPVVLPIIIFGGKKAAEYIKDECLQSAKVRETKALSCEEALKELQTICENLSDVMDNMNGFISWWMNMETHLGQMRRKITTKFRIETIPEHHLTRVRMQWRKVAANYQVYVSEIHRLQDFYPMGCRRGEQPATPRTDFSSTINTLVNSIEQCQTAFQSICAIPTTKHGDLVGQVKTSLQEEYQHTLAYLRSLLAYEYEVAAASAVDMCPTPTSVGSTLEELEITAQRIFLHHKQTEDLFASTKSVLVKWQSKKDRSLRFGGRKPKNTNTRAASSWGTKPGAETDDEDKHPLKSDVLNRSVVLAKRDPTEALSLFEDAHAAIALSIRELSGLSNMRRDCDTGADLQMEISVVNKTTANTAISKISLCLESFSLPIPTLTPRHHWWRD